MDKEAVKAYLEEAFPTYVADLERMTRINSQHKDPKGNQEINAWLRRHIQETGGQIRSWQEEKIEHLAAEYTGKGRVKIALIVHIDTVLDNRSFTYSYDPVTKIAKGPGVGDCKASVVMLMHLVQAYRYFNHLPFGKLTIYYDAEEEISGSALEERIVEELAKSHDYVLVADTGRPNYGICVRRKCSSLVSVKIYGINGHGGNALQAGANALYEAGFLITKFFALQSPMGADHHPRNFTTEALKKRGIEDRGQFIPENTLNIRSVTHSSVNIPDYAEIQMNLACFNPAERDRIAREIQEICQHPSIPGCRIECEIKPVMQAMMPNKILVDVYKKTAKEVAGIDISEWQAGGLTMANVASLFAPTIDAVGVDCDPLIEHTVHEEIDLNTVIPRLLCLYFFIEELDKLSIIPLSET